MKSVKVGLLPLYVKLYDDCLSWMRPRIEAFHETIIAKLEAEGLEVLRSPLCRLEDEFRATLSRFEAEGAEAVITLHLAYSPSLESEKPLKECKLPIDILDTTPDYSFSPEEPSAGLDFDHGIHGVQDMCNLLCRNHVPFDLFVGHWEQSDVCRRVANCVRAQVAASALATARVGIIGEPFAGMGDFRVPYEEMKRDIGITVVPVATSVIGNYEDKVTEERVDALQAADEARFVKHDVSEEAYRRITKTSLAVKDWCEADRLDAFTINFLAVGRTTGFRHMVFDRACRAMEDGIGYAGEGDVLTAALVGALLRSWEDTSFVEMFCPNWKDNVIFLSHMGEYNLRVAANAPTLRVRPFPFGDSGDTYALMAPMKAGQATIVNLAPMGNGDYTLLAINGTMQPVPEASNFNHLVNGWFKPKLPIDEMLRLYSENGGTHHSALVYGIPAEALRPIAKRFGWKFVII
ncbi:MAG: hypothetical protein E7618_01965 [Ruminococcaceae bacterium]|nr:hypothetical protein [Oscillospiraceae bacterium]